MGIDKNIFTPFQNFNDVYHVSVTMECNKIHRLYKKEIEKC